MNFNELRSKLDAIAEELEEMKVVEAEAELEEETVSEDEPSALDIAKMDPQTRMQYNAALRRKNAGPDKRTRDEKAADMSAAQAKIAQQKASFDKPETDTYGDRLNKQLKMLKQRDAYNKAVSDMGGKTRKSKFSFEDEQIEEGRMSDIQIEIQDMVADGASNDEIKKAIPMASDSVIADIRGEMDESIEETQAVEEATVEVPVQELADIMKLAGYANYSDKIEEYANEPEEEYSDVEDQMIGLSGGLNGPKKAFAAAAGGDNPMDQEPTEIEEDAIATVEESLYKSYKQFLEEAEIELSPGVSIKTDKPGIYKGTKKSDGSFVGGKGGEAMNMAKRIMDKIEKEDPSSDAEAKALFAKHAGDADKEVKSLVMKELRRMDFFK